MFQVREDKIIDPLEVEPEVFVGLNMVILIQ